MTPIPIRRRHLARSVLVCAVGAVACIASWAQTAAPPQRQSLIAKGDTPNLFLLYTGDVIGYLDPCG
jgi:hypothetical protein